MKSHLDKIVNYIVDDTVIGETSTYVIIPSDSHTKIYLLDYEVSDIITIVIHKFYQYCEDTYMLKVHESCYVWDRYFDIFLNHVLKNMSGNLRYFP